MKNIIELNEVASTNDYLKENYEHLQDNTLVYAHKQTKGRGRLNHVWQSELGNLYFSILKKKNINYKSLFTELKSISISVVDLLNNHGINAMIKYPNDIVVGNKKIAGILIESLGSSNLDYIIVGLGLNINQKNFGILKDKAVSMSLLTSKDFGVNDILDEFIGIYENVKPSIKRYNNLSMVIGRNLSFESNIYNIEKIDVLGNLVLKNTESEIHVQMNEVSLEEIYK